jgi:hypothetical protein
MKINYRIVPAHSGTNIAEIQKAKYIFRQNVRISKFQWAENVQLLFTDINNQIYCTYFNLDLCELIGTEKI